ncbi:hypothetical protein FND36_08990 [Lachnospiraceae bacterium KGMB03038]|nr:hypothetical protein FND36_08990 [Lachnospiraceae bacterium KGMB03038]
MVIIDKAAWQIDGGIPEDLVIRHFDTVFTWLADHKMLSAEGKEELEDGIDDGSSLNEEMITIEGLAFLEACYDEYLRVIAKDKYGIDFNGEELEKIYKKYREFENFMAWAKQEFGCLIPQEYLSFLKKGEFDSTVRKYYVIDEENTLEISEWFTPDKIPAIYKNCCEEKMTEKYHLPILDSCGCVAVLNCDSGADTYGQIWLRTPAGYYDEDSQENIYDELEFVAEKFMDIISNLKDAEQLEEIGIF